MVAKEEVKSSDCTRRPRGLERFSPGGIWVRREGGWRRSLNAVAASENITEGEGAQSVDDEMKQGFSCPACLREIFRRRMMKQRPKRIFSPPRQVADGFGEVGEVFGVVNQVSYRFHRPTQRTPPTVLIRADDHGRDRADGG